jgi:hypothetical protein
MNDILNDTLKWISQNTLLVVGQLLGLGASVQVSAMATTDFPEEHITAYQWLWHIFFICFNGVLSGAIISTMLLGFGVIAVRLGFKDKFIKCLHTLIDKWDKE